MSKLDPRTLGHLVRHFMELTAARTLCQVTKCTLDRRMAGNVACWSVSLEACWGFKDAMRWLASEGE